ncbi:MAG: alanine racemase [Alphaproteobacteria bacterium]|nr:alanine racemase [Alphaproteobacteria bacterium]
MENIKHTCIQFLKKFISTERKDEPLLEIRLNKKNIFHNISVLKHHAPLWRIAPVVKSNAYGHGIVPIVTMLEEHTEVAFVCVDSYLEVRKLRDADIQIPILVLGPATPTTIFSCVYKKVAFTISTFKDLQALVDAKSQIHIHIEFDTGMHRRGFHTDELEQVVMLLEKSSLVVEGIFSHFVCSEKNNTITKKQIRDWNELLLAWEQRRSLPKYYHIANSYGFLYADTIRANVGRAGLALYGLTQKPLITTAVFSFFTKVVQIQSVRKGEYIGYGPQFKATKTMQVATIPVGYYEGLDRRLFKKGVVYIHGHKCQLLGIMSMNLAVCDVSSIECTIGDPVEIVSPLSAKENSIISMARISKTIPYDIVTHFNQDIKRVVVDF